MPRRNVHRHFAVGSALTTTLRAFGTDALTYLGLAVLAALPMAPFVWIGIAAGQTGAPVAPGVQTLTLLGQLVASVPSMIAFSAAVIVAHGTLGGERVDIGAALARAARQWRPVLGVSLVFCVSSFVFGVMAVFSLGLAIALGLTVGLGLGLAYGLAYPVAAIERLGTVASLRRAAHLTAGRRVAFLAFVLTCSALASFVFMILAFGAGIAAAIAGAGAGSDGFSIAMAVAMGAAYVLLAALTSVGTAVAYHQLRLDADGAPTENLASVFE